MQCRDLARMLRNYYSRSQSQSVEDRDLARRRAGVELHERVAGCSRPPRASTTRRWSLLSSYKSRLDRRRSRQTRSSTRAPTTFREWLAVVERRLGQLVAAAGGKRRPNAREHGSRRRTGRRSPRATERRRARQDAVARDRRRVLRSARHGVGVVAVPARRAVRLRADARRQERDREPAADHSRARGRRWRRSGAR